MVSGNMLSEMNDEDGGGTVDAAKSELYIGGVDVTTFRFTL